jgi:hypothetical protein
MQHPGGEIQINILALAQIPLAFAEIQSVRDSWRTHMKNL